MENQKSILFRGQAYQSIANETILETLLRHKVDVPYDCKQMSCLSCMMRSLNGTPPAQSQQVLKENQQLQNLFLACGCIPHRDMEVALVEDTDNTIQVEAEVVAINWLNSFVLELSLQCAQPFHFYGGQSVLLLNHHQIAALFSIASPSSASSSGRFEIHVQRSSDAPLSHWLCNKLEIGDKLIVSGVNGELFYTPGKARQPLLLSVCNSNLAAMIGLVQDIFEHDHSGPVLLFHGVPNIESLYYSEELTEISEYYPNFKYIPCIEQSPVPPEYHHGSILQIMKNRVTDLSGWKIFLCGDNEQVRQLQRHTYLNGAGIKDIYLQVKILE